MPVTVCQCRYASAAAAEALWLCYRTRPLTHLPLFQTSHHVLSAVAAAGAAAAQTSAAGSAAHPRRVRGPLPGQLFPGEAALHRLYAGVRRVDAGVLLVRARRMSHLGRRL